jgi:Outer membrane protein beta-barrel domain
VKKPLLAILAFALLPLAALSQDVPKADVAAGYSFLRITSGTGLNMNGFNVSAAYNVSNPVGVVADFGVYHRSQAGASTTTETYTFGPRFSYRKAGGFVPFAQALVGGSHSSTSFGGFSGSSNPFAFSFGGGGNIALGSSGRAALRPEFDYLGFHANGSTSNAFRVSVGIVYNIGKRAGS